MSQLVPSILKLSIRVKYYWENFSKYKERSKDIEWILKSFCVLHFFLSWEEVGQVGKEERYQEGVRNCLKN